MSEWVLAVGGWAIALGVWYYNARFWEMGTPKEPPTEVRRTRVISEDPAWSPEGWGRPDSEVISTEGDDYLHRMHRPPPDEAA